VTRIGVPYFLTRHQPEVDLVVPVEVEVLADLDDGPGWSPLIPLYQRVAEAVADVVAAGGRPAVLTGDCTVALGVMAGLQRAGLDPGVVWYDAHGDVQTMETTSSGFLGGMPLRVLVGYRPELAATALGLRPVAEDRVTLVDARDLDPPEREFLSRSPMRRLPVADAPGALPDGPLYLHVDLDVVDPAELPEVRYPAPGGPSLAEVMASVTAVLRTGRVVGVGIACTWSTSTVAIGQLRELLEPALAEWESAGPNRRAAT
jgi:arginase